MPYLFKLLKYSAKIAILSKSQGNKWHFLSKSQGYKLAFVSKNQGYELIIMQQSRARCGVRLCFVYVCL